MKSMFRLSFFVIIAGIVAAIPSLSKSAAFNLALETDSNAAAGSEVFLASYNTFADLLNSNLASGQFSQINLGPNFSVGGLAYDGQYRLFFEGSAGSSIGEGAVQVQTYATLNDLLNFNLASSEPTSWTVGPNIDLAGVASPDSQIPPIPLPFRSLT